MYRFITIVTTAALLGACSTSPPGQPSAHSRVVGIPVLLSASASASQVTDELALTVAHNAGVFELERRSERFDAALVRVVGVPPDSFADPVAGETLDVWGTDWFGQPRRATVTVLDASQRDEYCTGTDFDPAAERDCVPDELEPYFITTLGTSPGDSGGGAYNRDGALVGIVRGNGKMTSGRQVSVFYRVTDLLRDLLPAQRVVQRSQSGG